MIGPSEKALKCEKNIRMLLEHHQIPIGPVLERSEDRVFCHEVLGIIPRMRALSADGKFSVSPLSMIKGHGDKVMFGWRELAQPSLQVILHSDGRVELDIDLGNPRSDLVGIITHAFEVLWPGKTDPDRVRRGLEKRGFTFT